MFNETSKLHLEVIEFQSWLAGAPAGHAVETFYEGVADEVAGLRSRLEGAGKVALKIAEALAKDVEGTEESAEKVGGKEEPVEDGRKEEESPEEGEVKEGC